MARDVDDIISVLSFLDEQKLLNDLPRYVSDSPDKIPSIRLFDGDLVLLLIRLDKVEGKLAEFSSTLAAITAGIHSGQASSTIPKVLSILQPVPAHSNTMHGMTATPTAVKPTTAPLTNSLSLYK